MSHKYDKYFLILGLLLPSVMNLLKFAFDKEVPHWLAISLSVIAIASLGIYVVRYRKFKELENTQNKK